MGQSGGVNLGTVYAKVALDASGIRTGGNEAKSLMQSTFAEINDTIGAFGQGLFQVGANMTALTSPLIAFGKTGLDAAADFDALMTQIEIFGGVTGDELQKVKDYALEMGAATKFSSGDAAEAMLDLLKSGQSLAQALETLPAVMDLAAAGEMSLAQASSYTTSALAQFGLSASDAGRVSNALAQAANASKADVGTMGQALNNAGSVAAQFGLDIEETAAVLGVFANSGIEGAEAGTQLKSMLLNMYEDTDKTKGAWNELGVSLYDANGNLRDLNTVIGEMDGAMDKLPVQRQNELMAQLGGSYGIVGLNALRASGGIGDMQKAMADAPAASDLAAASMGTFNGKVDSLMGSVETLQIQVLTPMMNDVLAPLVGYVTDVVNAMTAWAQENPAVAKTIVLILAAVTAIGPILMAVGGGISALSGVFGGLGVVLGAVLSPIGLIAAAVAGLFIAFETNFMGIHDLVEPIVTDLGALINTVFQDVVTFVQDTVLPGLDQLRVFFVETAMPAIVEFIQGTVVPGIQSFIDFLSQLWNMVAPALTQFADWFLTSVLPAVIDIVVNSVIPAVQSFADFLGQIWAIVSPALLSLADWFLTTGLPAIQMFISDIFLPAVQTFIDTLVKVWNDVSPFLIQLFDWFMTSGLPIIKDYIEGVVMPFFQAWIDLLVSIWNAVSPHLQSLYDWFITTALPGIVDFMNTTVTPAIQGFIDLLKGIWGLVEQPLNSLKDGMKGIFDFIVNSVIKPVTDALGGIVDAARDVLTAVGIIPQQGLVDTGSTSAPTEQLFGIPSMDSGGQGMAGMPYMIGAGAQPELFVPSSGGNFIPNFDQVIKQAFEDAMKGVQLQNTNTVNVGDLHAQFQDTFEQRLMEKMRGSGF